MAQGHDAVGTLHQDNGAEWYDLLAEIAKDGKTTRQEWFALATRRGLADAIRRGDTEISAGGKKKRFDRAIAALVLSKWIRVDDQAVTDLRATPLGSLIS